MKTRRERIDFKLEAASANKQTCSAEDRIRSDALSDAQNENILLKYLMRNIMDTKKYTTKNQFRLNIYLSNKPLNIPLICASGARERSEMDEKARKGLGDLWTVLLGCVFVIFCISGEGTTS